MPTSSAAPARGAADALARANGRPRGGSEFREVSLTIGNGPRARVLRIRTLAEFRGDAARAVFCVTEPSELRNVNYCVVERRGSDRLEIELFLPFAGGAVRRLPAPRHHEGLLGSDFTYDDMRTWLPELGVYETVAASDDAVRVRQCVDGVARFDARVRLPGGFVDAIDYYAPGGSTIVRSYRASDLVVDGGVEVPRTMTMQNLGTGHRTRIDLLRTWHDRPFDTAVFDTRARPASFELLSAL